MAQDDRGADRPAEQSRPAADAGPEQVAATVAELYDSLRALAAGYLRRERPDHTLQPTALVHEAYMKLSQQDGLRWNDRLHFFHIASAQIRRILVDHARTRGRHKRGGQFVRVTFDENLVGDDGGFDLVDLDHVLDRLDRESATDRQIVELKFFGGLTEPEIGEVLGISERTVRRRWLFARTWLLRELSRDGGPA
ncbi:sigma-70 family RNA polymerase sigma factor [bacterium]|nr:sigma-70 family RNA polymerase sigma factor [bacterium]